MGKEEGRGGGKEGGKEGEREEGREEKDRERCGEEEKDMGELESGGVLGIFRDVIYILFLICTSFFFLKKKQVRRRF